MTSRLNIVSGTLIDFYRITELIGRGGFSEVWSAWDERLKRLVAVKILSYSTADAHNIIQFQREATVITHLEHPHILPLYDFGQTPEFRFLVMRYVTGGTLAKRLEHGPISTQEILSLMIPIASTLDYVHEQRVIHRDLKPANILLDAQGAPYLADFGLAKRLSEDTTPMHSASGTIPYMSPEQFTGGTMSVQSDQYSFGLMLYQLFTGTLPYDGEISLGMRQLRTREKLTDVCLTNPTLPPQLNDYLQQLTDPEPSKRPDKCSPVMHAIADLFASLDTGKSVFHPLKPIPVLESDAYRRREIESILQEGLKAWQAGRFTLSKTHFLILDMLLHDLDIPITSDCRSLMIRGALEYSSQGDWWNEGSDPERKQACWHAITQDSNGSDAAYLQAIQQSVLMPWVQDAPLEIISSVSKHLMPLSTSTELSLTFLEHALSRPQDWLTDGSPGEVDNKLCALATSQSPLANRAAALIGTARRTGAVTKLSLMPGQRKSILNLYEAAGSLPQVIPTVERLRLWTVLAFRQLSRQPWEIARQWAGTIAGNIFAVALIIFVTAQPRFIDQNALVLNTIGLGLLYGLIFGVGVCLTRHISSRLQIAPSPLRIGLGILAGGLAMAGSFMLYNQLVLENILDWPIALYSGLLYVGGFAISVSMPTWAQLLLGTAGASAALLIPWARSLQDYSVPPIDFGDISPGMILALVISATFLMTLFSLSYRWRRGTGRLVGQQQVGI